MSFLFNRKKSAAELCKSVRKHLDIVKHRDDRDADPDEVKKSFDKLVKYLHMMKVMVFGDPETENSESLVNEEESCKLTDELLASTLLQQIIELAVCGRLPFETRKEASAVATYILHSKNEQSVNFLKCHGELTSFLVSHYASASSEGLPDVALECGALIREAIHHPAIAQNLINDPKFVQTLFSLIQEKQFDISSDAWVTLNLLLTEPKAVAASYLETNFDWFVSQFTTLLLSDNFVNKRQALKLLSDLLVCRSNYNFMIRYTASTACLKNIMNLCRTKSLAVQLEAFNVLKLFVANPRKSDGVIDVLSRNRQPLIAFLKKIAEGGNEEEKLGNGNGSRYDEAYILIAELEKLPVSENAPCGVSVNPNLASDGPQVLSPKPGTPSVHS